MDILLLLAHMYAAKYAMRPFLHHVNATKVTPVTPALEMPSYEEP